MVFQKEVFVGRDACRHRSERFPRRRQRPQVANREAGDDRPAVMSAKLTDAPGIVADTRHDHELVGMDDSARLSSEIGYQPRPPGVGIVRGERRPD